jgi:hypothetical protein
MSEPLDGADLCVCIVSATGQNVFFAELLDAIAEVLVAANVRVERSVNRFPPWRDELVYLFVPHEYVPFVESAAHPGPAHLSRSVVLCTEQPGTTWFEESAAIAARSAIAIDINQLGVRELRRRGIKADLMQLGYFAGWDRWGGDDVHERPIDVTFMGGHTPRRGRALARCGRFLAERRTEFVLTESFRPHLEDSTAFLSGERRWAALQRAKLIVNVHRGEMGYFEWLRVVGAILNGCVVVTEHSVGFAPLVAGEHFVSVGYDRLPFAIDALLADPERIAKIRHAAYRYLRDELPMSNTVTPLIEAISEVGASRLAEGLEIPAPVPPLPRELPALQTEPERILDHPSDLGRVKAALKELVLGQAELGREIALIGRGEMLDRELSDRVETYGPRDRAVRVSVLLTVYNYADFVGRAIASVAASDFEKYELIVIDDCSQDDSLEVIQAGLESHPWVTATVVARRRNQGLAAARNCAVEHARGDLVFILDADNEIYPHALARLVEALDGDAASGFAYGIIEQFGPEGPRDLMSWQEWDPERLRYGNYVDAMAMIRRAAILDLGGYTEDPRLYGWEDFALWCSFATHGYRGLRVPEILARYRTGVYSMISRTNLDTTAAWSALVEQNRFLTA